MSLESRCHRECFEHQFLVCLAVLGFGRGGLLDLRKEAERHLPHAGRGGDDRGFLSDFECLLDVLLLLGHRGRRSLPDEAGWLKRSLLLATLPGHELLFGKARTMVNSVCSAGSSTDATICPGLRGLGFTQFFNVRTCLSAHLALVNQFVSNCS